MLMIFYRVSQKSTPISHKKPLVLLFKNFLDSKYLFIDLDLDTLITKIR